MILEKKLTKQIIGAAIEVHQHLGLGLLESVDTIAPIHEAQLLTYLRLSGMKVGLIINFNMPILKEGIKRLVF